MRTRAGLVMAVEVDPVTEQWRVAGVKELEGGMPLVFIDNLDIRRRKTSRRRIDENQDVYMDVRFDVTGYMRAETS